MLFIYSRPPLQDFGGSFLNFQMGKNAGPRAGTWAGWPRARAVGRLVPERRPGFSHRSPTLKLRTIEAPSWEGRGSYFQRRSRSCQEAATVMETAGDGIRCH